MAARGNGKGRGPAVDIASRVSLIEQGGLRFLIMDAPSEYNLPHYLREMKAQNVEELVRVCDPTYPTESVEQAGIRVHHWPFLDGEPPPEMVIKNWLSLVDDVSKRNKKAGSRGAAIAVHCVAGLGRAPVLVALALIEYGMDRAEAIQFIRRRRRGAINQKQMQYILEKYKKRPKKGESDDKKCCIIS